jgi:outer membrane biosynthesis protein TonB
MKSAGTIAVILLLPIFVVGCKHQTQAAPPPAAQAPILPPSTMSQAAPPPQMPPPQTPEVKLPDKEPEPEKKPEHPLKRKKPSPTKPSTPTTTTPSEAAAASSPPTEQAAVGQPSEASPIGQLSTASDSVNTPPRQKIQDQINSTENGLKRIKTPLNTDDQKTVTQIRTFLDKAKQALGQDDLDGAQTLLTKAKVLLDELTSKE